jgi:hypothetical protein
MRFLLEIVLAANTGLKFPKIGMSNGDIGAKIAHPMTVGAIGIAGQVVACSQIM